MSFVNSIVCPGCKMGLIVRTEISRITRIPFISFSRGEVVSNKCPQCSCEFSMTVRVSSAPLMGTTKRPDFMDEPIESIVRRDLLDVFPAEPQILMPTPTSKSNDSRFDNKG